MTFYDMIMRMKGVNMFDSFPLLKTDLLPYKSLPSQVILVSTIGEQIGNNAPPRPLHPDWQGRWYWKIDRTMHGGSYILPIKYLFETWKWAEIWNFRPPSWRETFFSLTASFWAHWYLRESALKPRGQELLGNIKKRVEIKKMLSFSSMRDPKLAHILLLLK